MEDGGVKYGQGCCVEAEGVEWRHIGCVEAGGGS